jgi:glutaconate CoA-transferase subunit A
VIDRRCTIEAAVAGIAPGSSVGLGGVLDRRRPTQLCRALAAVAAGGGLHVLSFFAGAETELLAAAGAVASLTTGYVDPRAHTPALSAAIDAGTVELREVSEHLFVSGLWAAGAGLPFWPTLGAFGSDVAAAAGIAIVECPYTGRSVHAVRATPLDVAVLHVEAATLDGFVLPPTEREFLDDADIALARAARRVVVSVDRIAERLELTGRPAWLGSFEVDAVVVAPEAAA